MMRPAALILTTAALAIGAIGTARAEDYFAHARQLMAAGNLRGAKIELQNEVRQHPKNGAAEYLLAKLDFALGNPVAAATEARSAKANGYDQGKATSLLLDTYLVRGQPGQLLRDFPKAEGSPDVAARIAVGRARAEMALGELGQAKTDLASARKLAPKSPEPLLAEAEIALAHRDIASAKHDVDAALALDPQSSEALVHQAQLQLATGQPKAAVATLGPLVKRAPEEISARLLEVQALLAAGRSQEAKEKLKGILAIVPNSGQGLYFEAVLSAQAHDFKSALQTLQKLSPIIGRIPGAYLLQAEVMVHLGQIKQASEAAHRYLARAPGDPRGAYLLADLDLRTGKVREAVATLKTLSPAAQRTPAAIELLGRSQALSGNFRAAETSFEQVVKRAPKAAAPHAELGVAQLSLGNAAAAIASFQQALDLQPADAATRRRLILAALGQGKLKLARENLAVLKKQEGDTAVNGNLEGLVELADINLPAAHSQFAKVVKKYPKFVPAVMNLARVEALQGHVDEAEALVKGVLAHDPTNAKALQVLTRLLVAENKPAEAVALLTHAHKAAPTNIPILTNLIVLDVRTKKAKKALTLLEESNTLNQRYPVLVMGLEAQAYLALGDTKNARAVLGNLLQAKPSDVSAVLLLARVQVKEKNYKAAERTVGKALEAEPRNYTLMQAMVGAKFEEGGLAGGLKEAARLASNPQYLPAARALAGDLEASTKHPAAAALAYASALKAEPDSLALTLRYVVALESSGQAEKAAEQLRSYIGRHPKALPAFVALARIDISAGRLDAAAARLKTILAQDGNNVEALNNLAWIDQKQDRPGASILAKRAYFLSPNGHTADTLGWILVSEHSAATGLPLLRQAHAALPGSATVTYHLAAALDATGDAKAASELLHPIVTAKADFPEKAAAQALLTKIAGKP